jgi:hypothetical protein
VSHRVRAMVPSLAEAFAQSNMLAVVFKCLMTQTSRPGRRSAALDPPRKVSLMSSSVSRSSALPAQRRRSLTVATGLLGAVVVASAGNTVVALLARAAGASGQFAPLHPSSYVPLTVIGTVIGAICWAVVGRVARKPAQLLRRLVPAVVVASFVPDLTMLGGRPGSSSLAVAALMCMHVVVATVAVLTYRRVLPLPVD